MFLDGAVLRIDQAKTQKFNMYNIHRIVPWKC